MRLQPTIIHTHEYQICVMKPCSVASATVGWRSFTRDGQQTHEKRLEKRLSARQKILLKRVFLRSKMISTSSAHMMPDRPDKSRTIDIMSGPNYPDGQDTPLQGCPSVRGWIMSDRYTGLYFVQNLRSYYQVTDIHFHQGKEFMFKTSSAVPISLHLLSELVLPNYQYRGFLLQTNELNS